MEWTESRAVCHVDSYQKLETLVLDFSDLSIEFLSEFYHRSPDNYIQQLSLLLGRKKELTFSWKRSCGISLFIDFPWASNISIEDEKEEGIFPGFGAGEHSEEIKISK